MNIYEFAINMENDAEKFYTQQAEINKGNNLEVVFEMLAKDEIKHAKILHEKFNNLPFELDKNESIDANENIFKGIGNFVNELTERAVQLDVYKGALEKEKQSVDLYEDLLTKATNDIEKLLLSYLIKQEKKHCSILDELVLRVSRPIEWVEDAEFGKREQY